MGTGLGQVIPIAAYLVIVAACVLSAVWRPQIGIYVVIPLLPFEVLRARLEDYPLGSHVIYLLVLSVIAGLFLRSQMSLPSTPINKALLIFCVYLYISLWRGAFFLSGDLPLLPSDPRVAVWKDFMALPLLFAAALGAVRTPAQIRMVVLIVCLSVLIVDRSALLNVLSHNFTHFDESKRDGGPLGYAGSNGLAAFEAQCGCFLLGLAAFETRRWRKFVLYSLAGLTTYCLLYAFSRGGYISFLAGVLVLGAFRNRKIIVVAIALLLAWQTVVPSAVQERIAMTYNEDAGLEQSAGERVQLWTDATRLIADNTVMGTGYATYMYLGRVGQLKDTHNVYLKVLVETGIIGIALFLWVLAGLFRIAMQLFRSSEDPFHRGLGLGLLSLFGCLILTNLFGDRWTYVEINGVVWVLFAVAARALVLERSALNVIEEVAPDSLPRPEEALAHMPLAGARGGWN